MDDDTYSKIRRYCRQELAVYLDTPENEASIRLAVKLANSQIGRIAREQELAISLVQCHDLTPREDAAARLLAVISNHRAIAWQREPSPPNGRKPAPPIEKSMADALALQTRQAVEEYAACLPERECAALLKVAGVPDTAPEQNTATPAPVVTAGASAGVIPVKAGPDWRPVTSLKRAPGYRWPLYQLLKAAHSAGQPCPKARDVVTAWEKNPPPNVQAMSDGVKYDDGLGNPKEAGLKAIQQAIKGLLQ